jgi:hypothetical protein
MFDVAHVDPIDDTGDWFAQGIPGESPVLRAATILCCHGQEGT